MRGIGAIAALALILATGTAAAAELTVTFGTGAAGKSGTEAPTGAWRGGATGSPSITRPPRREPHMRHMRRGDGHGKSHRHRRAGRHRHRLPVYPVYRYEPEPYDLTPLEPPPAQPEAAAQPEPVVPPDPQGPLRLAPARGAVPEGPRWELGQPLPPDLPHVTLDWRRYDLPEPPPGRIYARVGRTVLLITAGERLVETVVTQPG